MSSDKLYELANHIQVTTEQWNKDKKADGSWLNFYVRLFKVTDLPEFTTTESKQSLIEKLELAFDFMILAHQYAKTLSSESYRPASHQWAMDMQKYETKGLQKLEPEEFEELSAYLRSSKFGKN